jgi:low affinity Fe/Cu permease
MRSYFRRIAQAVSAALGSAWAFALAIILILVWVATGPIFHFSDTWQLIINTVTNVVTFWMVFIIQNSQNRDSKAMLLKLDELIRSNSGARNRLMNLETVSEEELESLEQEFARLRAKFGHTGSIAAPEHQRDR